jgi:sugar-specific transcriptional regulator TrmB
MKGRNLTFENEDLRIFLQLGMTMQQTKVYIALNKLEQATVKTIAKTAQMERAEVYRAIAKLQKLGLIKKLVTTPTVLRATPLSEGLTILLQLNAEKHKEMRAKAEQFLRNLNHNRQKSSQESSQYYLTLGPKPVERDYIRDLSETQTSKDCILDWKSILYVINRTFEYVKEALERGVKIRYVTHIPEGTNMPQIIQTLTKTGSFEVKSASTIPKAGIDIFDKKIVHIVTSPTYLEEIEVLRSTNSEIVELEQDYFELKWQSATTPTSTKNHQ